MLSHPRSCRALPQICSRSLCRTASLYLFSLGVNLPAHPAPSPAGGTTQPAEAQGWPAKGPRVRGPGQPPEHAGAAHCAPSQPDPTGCRAPGASPQASFASFLPSLTPVAPSFRPFSSSVPQVLRARGPPRAGGAQGAQERHPLEGAPARTDPLPPRLAPSAQHRRRLIPTPPLALPQVDIDKLDYHHYLPIFFDGIREREEPYRFLAREPPRAALPTSARSARAATRLSLTFPPNPRPRRCRRP